MATSEAVREFDTVVRAYGGMVQDALRRLGVAPSALDDASQEVFLAFYRRFSEFDAQRSVANWLWGIARGVASTHRRGRARAQRLRGAIASEARGHSVRPDDAAALREARRMLTEFLASLDADKCAVFVLAEIEGRTGPEISAELEVNLNTVYARLRSARALFDQAVQGHRDRLSKVGGFLPLAGWGTRWGVRAKVATASLSSVAAAVLVLPAAAQLQAPPTLQRAAPIVSEASTRKPSVVAKVAVRPAATRPQVASATMPTFKPTLPMRSAIAALALSTAVAAPSLAHAKRAPTAASSDPIVSDDDADAAAQLTGDAETRAYIFGDEILDGDINSPEGINVTRRARVRHQSLIRIRGHFIRELMLLGTDI